MVAACAPTQGDFLEVLDTLELPTLDPLGGWIDSVWCFFIGNRDFELPASLEVGWLSVTLLDELTVGGFGSSVFWRVLFGDSKATSAWVGLIAAGLPRRTKGGLAPPSSEDP